jgi:hypothetical protein
MGEDSDVAKTRQLMEAGADLIGVTAGATIGTLVADPLGIIGGAAAGVAIKGALLHVGAEIHDRILGPRERVRVGAAFARAYMRIKENLDAGKTPRADGFFDAQPGLRSPAEELLEGVLLKAQDAYEESKVALLGNLYANLAFSTVARADANLILAYVGSMSYRELVCLGFIPRCSDFATPTWQTLGSRGAIWVEDITLGVLHDIWDLYQKFLIYQSTGPEPSQRLQLFSPVQIDPSSLSLHPFGAIMIELMELRDIPAQEVDALVIQPLWHPGTAPADAPPADAQGVTSS